MIITLFDSIQNKQGATILAGVLHDGNVIDFSTLSFDTMSPSSNLLFIIDIENEFHLTSRLPPNDFANYLIESGLPREINKIYLIMSDVDNDINLVEYAHKLALCFTHYHQRKIEIHILSQLNYDCTRLVLPSQEGRWEVYGYNKPLNLKNPKIKSATLDKSEEKKLLWQGTDLIGYMNDDQRIYNGVSYVWP